MESLERRDICPGCWTKNHKAEPGKLGGYISHWQGVYEVPPPPPPEAIQKDNAETLLEKLAAHPFLCLASQVHPAMAADLGGGTLGHKTLLLEVLEHGALKPSFQT